MTVKNLLCNPVSSPRWKEYVIKRFIPLYFLFLFLVPHFSFSQESADFEEISVFLYVPQLGVFEAPAYIRGESLFLPVSDIFTFLKIKNTVSPESDSVTGFFINTEAKYSIDRTHNRITYLDKVYELQPGDIVRTETNLYLKSNYFGEIFGLECNFQFHNLSVYLHTQYELPLIKEMRIAMMRRNINRIRGEIKPDSVLRRNYPAFHFGMVDWTINASQLIGGISNLNMSLALGSVIAGGEADFAFNYNKNVPFSTKQQVYYWHFVNNDQKYVRQVTLGKVSTVTKSTLYGSIIGFNVTNTPTRYRQSFCTYILSDYTEPNWTVELYIKNVLVDYTTADASGFFTFSVPLQYGSTTIRYKFYSPWGEERFKEQTINIPFTLLPPKILEYSITGGIIEDSRSTRFTHAAVNYGIGKRMTLGGGIEYNSSVTSGNFMPFINFSLGLTTKLLISGEYTYGVRALGMANYHFQSGLVVELYYTWFHRNQKAMIIDYLENRRATLSLPLRIGRFSAYLRYSMNQVILYRSSYLYSELLFSGSLWGVSTNLTTTALVSDPVRPDISSSLSLGFRFLRGFLFTPQIQYNYSYSRFISAKLGLEKILFDKGALTVSYDYNFMNSESSVQLGLRYDFPFTQAAVSSVYNRDGIGFFQSAKGSLMYDKKTHYLKPNNRTSVGKGGLTIIAFLDMNWNGIHDKNEPKVSGINIKIPGGQIDYSLKDTLIRVFDLEPYTNYFVELDYTNFNNVAWQVKNKTLGIAIDPNQFKLVEIPVTVGGEISGTVYKIGKWGKEGLGRVYVCFYDEAGHLLLKTLSESDGYFSHLGFRPGNYTVMIDTAQLRKIKMVSEPAELKARMYSSVEGPVVDGLEFVIRSVMPDSTATEALPSDSVRESIARDTAAVALHEQAPPRLETREALPVNEPEKVMPPVAVPGESRKITPEIPEVLPLVPAETRKISPVAPVETRNVPAQKEQEVAPPAVQQQRDTLAPSQETGDFHIQIGAFRKKANALAVLAGLKPVPGHPVMIIYQDHYYKLRITGFSDYDSASRYMKDLIRRDFPDSFIFKNRQ